MFASDRLAGCAAEMDVVVLVFLLIAFIVTNGIVDLIVFLKGFVDNALIF